MKFFIYFSFSEDVDQGCRIHTSRRLEEPKEIGGTEDYFTPTRKTKYWKNLAEIAIILSIFPLKYMRVECLDYSIANLKKT